MVGAVKCKYELALAMLNYMCRTLLPNNCQSLYVYAHLPFFYLHCTNVILHLLPLKIILALSVARSALQYLHYYQISFCLGFFFSSTVTVVSASLENPLQILNILIFSWSVVIKTILSASAT